MLLLALALMLGAVAIFVGAVGDVHSASARGTAIRIIGAVLIELVGIVLLFGLFTLQPNEARVLILFGRYHGTVRHSGFHWANPFYARSRANALAKSARADSGQHRIAGGKAAIGEWMLRALPAKLSLRAHNFNSQTLKVNDKRGNPVEIAAVVVWRVENTAQAVFDVEDYVSYVQVQSESAIRSVASRYAYDYGEEHETTLRGGADEVAVALAEELQQRLVKAGVVVEEARLTHLAYAPEIAQAMLRRQQAEATIAARQLIVRNAVSMVQMALSELNEKHIVALDDERKAAMVSNLLVVLCGSTEASPVINAGTLYN
jgi:regulator of protease activity HflC (stomatin/prohibitin superfamily)